MSHYVMFTYPQRRFAAMLYRVAVFLFLFVAAARVESAVAGGAHLVKDITPADQASGGIARWVAGLSGDHFALGFNNAPGLWSFDARTKKTSLIKKVASAGWRYDQSVIDGRIYFQAVDGAAGNELWVSDGTTTGTALVADVNPNGDFNPVAGQVAKLGDDLYVFGNAARRGGVTELWKINSTTHARTLLKRFDLPAGDLYLQPDVVTVGQNAVYFVLRHIDGSSYTGVDLWCIDTADGSVNRVYSRRGANADRGVSGSLSVVNDEAYFVVDDSGSNGTPELWVSDGTTDSARAVDMSIFGSNVFRLQLFPAQDRVFVAFASGDSGAGISWQLWCWKNGTATFVDTLATHVFLGPVPVLSTRGSTFALYATDDQTSVSAAIKRTDGTVAGTALVATFAHTTLGSIRLLDAANDATDAWVVTGDSYLSTLWHSDGSTDVTVNLGTIEGGVRGFKRLSTGTAVLLAGNTLWRSDATPDGTAPLKTFTPGWLEFAATDDYVVVSDSIGMAPRLFVTDGTPSGSAEIDNVGPAGSTTLVSNTMGAVDGRLLFHVLASPTSSPVDVSTWLTASDGENAQPLADTKHPISSLTDPEVVAAVNGLTLLKTDTELFAYDSTSGTVSAIAEMSIDPHESALVTTDVDGKQWSYFGAIGAASGQFGLWKSDGTKDGTLLLATVLQLVPDGGDRVFGMPPISSLTLVGGTLYFRVYASDNRAWLGRSDGTPEGTRVITDIATLTNGTFASYGPRNLIDVNGILFFLGDDGEHGYELWRSDGTGEGTRMVRDTNPSNANWPWWPIGVKGVALGSTLLFVADDGAHGLELWKSDGTTDGTVMVKDINPNGDSWPKLIGMIHDKVLFTADDGVHGSELWVSDGTSAGTTMLIDIDPSASLTTFSGWFSSIRNGEIYFSANDGVHGYELWKSDGTASGTVMVQDIAADSESSLPGDFAFAGDQLYFTADDGVHGRELWALPVNGAGNSGEIPGASDGGGGAASMELLLLMLLGRDWRVYTTGASRRSLE